MFQKLADKAPSNFLQLLRCGRLPNTTAWRVSGLHDRRKFLRYSEELKSAPLMLFRSFRFDLDKVVSRSFMKRFTYHEVFLIVAVHPIERFPLEEA
ncbi:hypothetical protein ASD86_09775 [Lysobacter sp. Root690]|nr:hypothetical protein ASD86_09775 [Lysobacter sp. Root690]